MKTILIAVFAVFLFSAGQAVASSYYGGYDYTYDDYGYDYDYGYYSTYNYYTPTYYPTQYVRDYYPSYYSTYTRPTDLPACPMNAYRTGNSACVCVPGYGLSSGECVQLKKVCENQIGLMSYYNDAHQACECSPGYTFNGLYCAVPTTYGYTPHHFYH